MTSGLWWSLRSSSVAGMWWFKNWFHSLEDFNSLYISCRIFESWWLGCMASWKEGSMLWPQIRHSFLLIRSVIDPHFSCFSCTYVRWIQNCLSFLENWFDFVSYSSSVDDSAVFQELGSGITGLTIWLNWLTLCFVRLTRRVDSEKLLHVVSCSK